MGQDNIVTTDEKCPGCKQTREFRKELGAVNTFTCTSCGREWGGPRLSEAQEQTFE